MNRRRLFLSSLLAPLVALFKPVQKPSVEEIADAARSYKTWYSFEQKYSDGISQREASFEGGNDLQDSLIYEVPKVYRIKVYKDDRLIADIEVPETVKFLML